MIRFSILARLLLVFGLALASASTMAQDEAAQVITTSGGSATTYTDANGWVYFHSSNQLLRYHPSRQVRDTVYTHTPRPIGFPPTQITSFTFGPSDSVVYFAVFDTLYSYNLNQRRRSFFWRDWQYPNLIRYNPADSSIYALEGGLDNGRNPSIGAYHIRTQQRRHIAGPRRGQSQGPSNYVNDTASRARFYFPYRSSGGRFSNGGALIFNRTNDTLIFADPENWCIRYVSLRDTVVGTLAGPLPGQSNVRTYRDITNPLQARFYSIWALEIDSRGFIYVGDRGNFNDNYDANGFSPGNRIRKIAPNGRVYTLAGNGLVQGRGQFNNLDFIAGIGRNAMIGGYTGMGWNRTKDTLYVSLGQRAIRLAKRRQPVVYANFIDRLIGSGRTTLVATTPAQGKLMLSLASSPQNVTLVGDTLEVPANAQPGIVRIAVAHPGDEDSYLPFVDTVQFRILGGETLTLKKLRDFYFGEGPVQVSDSVSTSSGLPAFIRLRNVAPANCVALDTLTNTLTINAPGTVIYHGLSRGNDTTVAVFVQDTFQVLRAPQVLAIQQQADVRFGSTPNVTLTTSTTNGITNAATGLTVALSLVNTPASVATLNAGTGVITLVGVGAVTVRAAQTGTPNYLPAVPDTMTFRILRGLHRVTLDTIPDQTVANTPVQVSLAARSTVASLTINYSFTTSLTGLTITQTPPRISIPVPAVPYAGEEVTVKARAASANYEADSAIRTFKIFSLVSAPRSMVAGKLELWPNPANESAQLLCPADATGWLTDAAGKRVLELAAQANEPLPLNLKTLPAGLYHVQLQNSAGQRYQARIRKQ